MAVKHTTTVFHYLTWCSLVERAKIFRRKLLPFFLKEKKRACTLEIHAGISKNMVNSDENSRRRKSEYRNLDTKNHHHHHKQQVLDPLIHSDSRVTAALANVF